MSEPLFRPPVDEPQRFTYPPPPPPREPSPRRRRWILAAGLAVAALIFTAYSAGAFDKPLSSVGLNTHSCATTLVGGKLCGDQLVAFCHERYDPQINGDVCRQVLTDAGQDPDAIARANARAEHDQIFGRTTRAAGPIDGWLNLDADPEHVAARVSYRAINAGQYDEVEPGRLLVGVEVAVANRSESDDAQVDPSSGLAVVLRGGSTAQPAYLSGGDCPAGDGSTMDLAPGEERKVCVPFTVRAGESVSRVEMTLTGSDGTDKAIAVWRGALTP